MNNKKQKKIKPQILSERKTKNIYLSGNKILVFYLILFIGFALRIMFLLEINNSPLAKTLFSDSLIYFENAGAMVKNNSFFGAEVFYMSPLYTYFLSFIQLIFSDSIIVLRLIQIFVSTVTIGIIYLTGKKLHSENAGLIASAICSVYALFIFYSSAILVETLLIFLVSCFFFLLTKEKLYNKKSLWLLIGVCLGFSAILRASVLVFLLPVFAWLYFNYKKKLFEKKIFYKAALFFLLGCSLTIAPITIQNFIAEKDFVLITSNGGLNFFIGNNMEATGIYQLPKEFNLSIDLTGRKFAEKELQRELKSSEVSSYWFSKGINYVINEPASAVILYFKKILLFFSEDENAQSGIMDMRFMKKNYSTVLNYTIPGFLILFLLSVPGILLNQQKSFIFKFLLILLLLYILMTALFFVVGRFRLTVTPLFMVLAGIGTNELWKIFKAKAFNKLKIPAIVLLVVISINFTLTPKFIFSDSDDYMVLGDSFFNKGQYDDALLNYNKSFELRNDAATLVLIANTYSAKKDVNNAMLHYRKAVEMDSLNVLAYFNVGILYTQLGSFPDAIRAFNKAIEIDPEYLAAYKNMAIIYYISEDYKNSLYYFEKVLKMSRDKEEQATVLQDIQNLKQKLSGNNN